MYVLIKCRLNRWYEISFCYCLSCGCYGYLFHLKNVGLCFYPNSDVHMTLKFTTRFISHFIITKKHYADEEELKSWHQTRGTFHCMLPISFNTNLKISSYYIYSYNFNKYLNKRSLLECTLD